MQFKHPEILYSLLLLIIPILIHLFQLQRFVKVPFTNVKFLKNIDIWGFVMVYIVLYEELYKSFDELNEYQMEFINKIKYIIIHFLYENPIDPIDISSLVNELTNLNKVIEKYMNLNRNHYNACDAINYLLTVCKYSDLKNMLKNDLK